MWAASSWSGPPAAPLFEDVVSRRILRVPNAVSKSRIPNPQSTAFWVLRIFPDNYSYNFSKQTFLRGKLPFLTAACPSTRKGKKKKKTQLHYPRDENGEFKWKWVDGHNHCPEIGQGNFGDFFGIWLIRVCIQWQPLYAATFTLEFDFVNLTEGQCMFKLIKWYF